MAPEECILTNPVLWFPLSPFLSNYSFFKLVLIQSAVDRLYHFVRIMLVALLRLVSTMKHPCCTTTTIYGIWFSNTVESDFILITPSPNKQKYTKPLLLHLHSDYQHVQRISYWSQAIQKVSISLSTTIRLKHIRQGSPLIPGIQSYPLIRKPPYLPISSYCAMS